PDGFAGGAGGLPRGIDQLALAQAAQAAAQAMLDIPPVLRADGTPMPPFRMPPAAVRGDELASVVGGHTVTGHGAAIALEPRGFRWTVAVLGVAALLGIIAAVVIQTSPSRLAEPAPPPTQPAIRPVEEAAAPVAEAPSTPEAQDTAPPVPPRPIEPTIQEPSPPPVQTAATLGAEGRAGDEGAGDAKVNEAHGGDAKIPGSGASGSGSLIDARTVDGNDPSSKAGKAATGKAATGKASDGRSNGKKLAAGKDGGNTGKRKAAQGILQVDADPWSWVTVDVETKETPNKFYLPPGNHIVKFYNQENGLTRYERIVIEPDKVTKLSESMER
ncbi:MAG TPA: hypothetical protein VF469_24420, partial [Kofleriaceae bacterium]